MDRKQLLEKLDSALELSPFAETQIMASTTNSGLTRFYENLIHQGAETDELRVVLTARENGREALTELNSLEKQDLNKAYENLRNSIENGICREVTLPLADPADYAEIDGFDPAVNAAGPGTRARLVEEFIEPIRQAELNGYGALTTSSNAMGLANTRGLKAFHRSTKAEMVGTALADTGSSGQTQRQSFRLDRLDVADLGRRAAEKALLGRERDTLDLGTYEVILEPAAVSPMVQEINFFGLSGKAFLEGRSFMSGKLGQKLTGDNFTLTDDPFDPENPGSSFDLEGTPTCHTMFFENGVARGVAFDREFGNISKTGSTGHSLLPTEARNPSPTRLAVAAGNDALEEMIRGVRHGVYVSRLWYNRMVDPLKTILTGLTRDGTFLIEDGKLTKGAKNMRFNMSILDAFSAISAISKNREVVMNNHVPAMRLERFTFTDHAGD